MSKGTMQRFTLIGRLGAEPEVKEVNGVSVCKLSIATTEAIKKKDSNDWEDVTTWHNVTLFGQNANFCRDYLKKGGTVYVEAKLRNNKWKDKEGEEHFAIEIIGNHIQGIGSFSGYEKNNINT